MSQWVEDSAPRSIADLGGLFNQTTDRLRKKRAAANEKSIRLWREYAKHHRKGGDAAARVYLRRAQEADMEVWKLDEAIHMQGWGRQ